MSSIEITNDKTQEVLQALEDQIEAGLEAIGVQAVSHAKDNITAAGRVDTGALRLSVSHVTDAAEKSVYIGTNQSYAIYNEMGTGIYTDGGGGRQDGWFYVDAKGEGHFTRGMKPIHFLKNAGSNYSKEYVAIMEKHLKE